MIRQRSPSLQFALGALAALVLIAVIIAISTGGGSGKPKAAKFVPPAHLPPLPQVYGNQAIGAAGRLPAGWRAERGPGFVTVASPDARATITILARSAPPGSHPRLLSPVVDAIRRTYGTVSVRHALGATLGGQPARSVVLYARNKRGVPIRILVAAAQGRSTAWVLEAITAAKASQRDLVQAQEIVGALRLVG